MSSIRNIVNKAKQIFLLVKNFLLRIFTLLQAWLVKNGPSRNTQKGAVIAIFIAILVYLGYMAVSTLRSGKGLLFDIGVGLIIGILCLIFISLGVRLVLRIISKIPLLYGSLFIGSLISFILFFDFTSKDTILFIVWAYLAIALLGGSIIAFFFGGFKSTKILNKIFVILAFFLSIASIVVFVIWLGKTGTEEGLIKVEKYEQKITTLLDIPDPSLDGNFEIKTTTYGSGVDRRNLFGKDVQIITESVNGKAFVNKLSGRFNKIRKRFWGFNRTKFPINGRVWYPDGEGKYPLVLIVHGNHSMREYSDPGYAYLGEFLASRGFIVVSVDENFLNGDWTKNYRTESDARGWMLLNHLSVWQNWSKDSSNIFYDKVDLENISLIGHSRGGEAVAIAASFNNLSHYPDDANVLFDFHFNIKSIIAIAPVDGQYKPSDQPTPLNNINYLLLHGSHDADVSSFSGDKQFKRIKFTDGEYKFKSSIYIYRANHGQFNTIWGNHDYGMPGALLLNTKALLDGEDQRQIAKVYIGAFLETTLKGKQDYLPIFRDYRYAENWLPETYYINRFTDSKTEFIIDYDEDIDVTTTKSGLGMLMGDNLRVWREEDIGFRRGNGLRLNKAVYLGWENPVIKTDSIAIDSTSLYSDSLKEVVPNLNDTINYPSYTFKLKENESLDILATPNLSMVFSIAQLDAKVPKHDSIDTSEEEENWSFNAENNNVENNNSNENKEEEENNENDQEENKVNKNEEDDKDEDEDDEKDKSKIPIDFTIELLDTDGISTSLQISEVISIMPPFESKIMRYKPFEKRYGKSSEPILQTVAIPIKLFQAKNPNFTIEKLNQINFIFNKSPKAILILDEIGFRK